MVVTQVPSSVCIPTDDHVEGPFYRPGAPYSTNIYPADSNGAEVCFTGTVKNTQCRALVQTLIEVWQCDENGRYDNDDPNHPPGPDYFRCRAHFFSDDLGQFSFRTVLPANYHPIPNDPWVRVKHVHFKLYTSGFRALTTEIALLPDEYAGSDHLFDPKLGAELNKRNLGEDRRNSYSVHFDFVLEPVSAAGYKAAAKKLGLIP